MDFSNYLLRLISRITEMQPENANTLYVITILKLIDTCFIFQYKVNL